jgi:hypothetical protein
MISPADQARPDVFNTCEMPTQPGTPVGYRADLLSFPTGRLTSGVDRAAVAVGYVAATVTPIAREEVAMAVSSF